MKKIKKLIGLLALISTNGLLLSACSNSQQSDNHKINVVSSLNFYAGTAKAVGGNQVKVNSIINSNVDPHDFEPTMKDSEKISKANVVIQNGLGYDDWMKNSIKNSGNHKQTDITVGNLMHKKDGDNEHVWYDPETVIKLTDKLTTIYSRKDPKHKKYFQQNAKQYKHSWQQNLKILNSIKQHSKNKKVAVSEPVFDYSLEYMGFQITDNGFANAIEKNVDPSMSDIKSLQHDIKHHKITFFVNNTQSSSPVVTQMVKLAKQNNIPIVNVTETEPANKNYVQWMHDEYQQVQKIVAK